MAVRKSLYINDDNLDVLSFFDNNKNASERIIQLIRDDSAKDREIELLNDLVTQQKQTIELYQQLIAGAKVETITIQHTVEQEVEVEIEDNSADEEDIESMFDFEE